MRIAILVIGFFILLVSVLPVEAAQPEEQKLNAMILQELKSISRKVDELKVQNQTLLGGQEKILNEVSNLKIHVRRRS